MEYNNDNKDTVYRLNITVLGKSGSGKTATLVKLLTKRFIGEYSSSTDKFQFSLSNDNKEYAVTIQDTNEEASGNLESVVKWSDVVVVMFSIIDRSSFNKAQIIVQNITEKCLREKNKYNISISLVANKTDLDRFRVVLSEDVDKFTKEVPVSYHESNVVGSYSTLENMFLQIIKNHLNDSESMPEMFNPRSSYRDKLRDKSSSPFTKVGMLNQSSRRLSTKTLLNSVGSSPDPVNRRGSVENEQRNKTSDPDSNLSASKTSLNTLFNSSTKRIKSEGFKLFKRPK